ncbi:MAG TPA: alpha-hydroxy acid oxidase [Gammaproteobacteria bacterium]|nr:alpha-hydroxy acid oxidase [Gammaproteobacteria bacterium]HRP87178.1 alpha-hydroxy acid oxidase [Gammaproteobacteria bacterium]
MALRRKLYAGRDFRRALSIEELRGIARRRLPHFAFEYIESGAEDESTLRWNRAIFEQLRFLPRTLVDTTARNQRTKLLGRDSHAPLVIAPTAMNGMLHRRGDTALARAAAAAGIPSCLSTFSNVRLEALAAEVQGRLWMQLYLLGDRAIARDIVGRAEQAGYEALVLTTDANVFGFREWDRRNYRAPGRLTLRNLFDAARRPRWALDVMVPDGFPCFENVREFLPPEAQSARAGVAHLPRLLVPDVSWADVEGLRRAWPRKLLVKGILTVEDARRAVDAGCDGIVLSNHGGRQLDGCISPLETLPEVVAAVGEHAAVLVDSGFRRGTDIVKALALGADAVMVGAATLYGLAAGGEEGARHAIGLLTGEIDRVLGQLGCNSVQELGPQLLTGGRDRPAG